MSLGAGAGHHVAIAGAGWAGLSCALSLARQGYQVTVFEASDTVGGRARRIKAPVHGATPGESWIIDNGQHLLLGAYTETLALMRELGLDPEQRFYREPLRLESLDGTFRLGTPAWPAPWNRIAALLTVRGVSTADRARFALFLHRALKTAPPSVTVAKWLAPSRPSAALLRHFWEPLCVAALNTPAHEACAQLLWRVLKDSLGGATRQATDVLIPRVDLTALWCDTAVRQLQTQHAAMVRWRTPVRRLQWENARSLYVNGEHFNALVIATQAAPARQLAAQLPAMPGSGQLLSSLAAFTYRPIATLTLRLERPWVTQAPMYLLHDNPHEGQVGQWLFNPHGFYSDPDFYSDPKVHVVVSDAVGVVQAEGDWLAGAVAGQVREQGGDLPPVTGYSLIVEKRATFAALPGLDRPDNGTAWPNVVVAGDWTATGYPAVLEGAVRSGRRAARCLADQLDGAKANPQAFRA